MGTAMWKGGIETSKMGRVKHVESPSVLDFIPRDRSWGATEKVSAGESDERSLKKIIPAVFMKDWRRARLQPED